MKQRKHRLVVEITLSREASEKQAKNALEEYLTRLDFDAKPVFQHLSSEMYADKVSVKQFSKVAGYFKRFTKFNQGEC